MSIPPHAAQGSAARSSRQLSKQRAASGYREMKLDTLPHMLAARALYRRFGFKQIAPYGSHPYPGLICLGRSLDIEE